LLTAIIRPIIAAQMRIRRIITAQRKSVGIARKGKVNKLYSLCVRDIEASS